MFQLVDTHAHLDMPDFSADLEEVLARAKDAGVGQVIAVGTDLASSERVVELARRRENLFAAVGVHPHEARRLDDQAFRRLADLARREKVVAIGEVGLDYYRDRSPRPLQREAFLRQLDLAGSLGLPVIIHCRQAHADLLEILRERGGEVAGVCHCFSGSQEQARHLLDLGLHISFTGTVTFPNASEVREVAGMVPLDRLLLETDCPYLAPQPCRGRRNEPAFLPHILRCLAELRGVDEGELASRTTANARRLFSLPTSPAADR